ncbi:MAG: hypothetical protein KGY70_08785, partial [Bacteroidales bacterium]|nr:hypothetical protein [Bacteroidales bacterium]
QTFKLPSNNSLILIGVGGFVEHRSQLVDMQVWGIREIHIFLFVDPQGIKKMREKNENIFDLYVSP